MICHWFLRINDNISKFFIQKVNHIYFFKISKRIKNLWRIEENINLLIQLKLNWKFWDSFLFFISGRSVFLLDMDLIFVGTSFLDFLRLSKTKVELLLSYPSTTIDLVRLLALTKSSRFLAKNDSLDWERSLLS